MRAADTPADLVELGEPEGVGSVHDDRIGPRDIQAVLDDRGGDQDVDFFFLRIGRNFFEIDSHSDLTIALPSFNIVMNSTLSSEVVL